MQPRDPLADAALWCALMNPLLCIVCGEECKGQIAYVAILIPQDNSEEPAHSGGVCRACGTRHDRAEMAQQVAQLTHLHAFTAGHA